MTTNREERLSSYDYDFLMRLPLLGWVAFCAMGQAKGLFPFFIMGVPIDLAYMVHLGMRVSTIAFLLLIAAAVIAAFAAVVALLPGIDPACARMVPLER